MTLSSTKESGDKGKDYCYFLSKEPNPMVMKILPTCNKPLKYQTPHIPTFKNKNLIYLFIYFSHFWKLAHQKNMAQDMDRFVDFV